MTWITCKCKQNTAKFTCWNTVYYIWIRPSKELIVGKYLGTFWWKVSCDISVSLRLEEENLKQPEKNTILRKKNLAYNRIVHAIIIQKMVKGKYKCQMVLADV